jgi:two-component system, LytTR family, response regulator
MRAIIIDDEIDGVRTLQKLLERHCPKVIIVGTANNADTAIEDIRKNQPDLVFLDIQMPGKTGLELLTEIGKRNFEVVFVTAYNEYMLQALQFSAADYILKPVDEDRLVEAVDRVGQRLAEEKKGEQATALLHNLSHSGQPGQMRLCLPTLKGFIVLKLEDIIFCEAERSYTLFHLEGGKTVTASRPLLDYENLLKGTTFLRVHKSFLINLLHVKEYQRGEGGVVIMTGGKEIEVSRRRKDEFLMLVKEVFKY